MKQSALFLVTALTTLFAPAATAQTMFVVDYVQSRTLGDRVIDSEEGTHTFSPDGHRRTDRLVRGEHTTEIVIPGETLGEGERIEINHTLVVARRGPLNVVPGRSLARQRSLTRTRPVPPDSPQYRAAQRRRESGQSTPMDYVGQEERGPLTLHHYRDRVPRDDGDDGRSVGLQVRCRDERADAAAGTDHPASPTRWPGRRRRDAHHERVGGAVRPVRLHRRDPRRDAGRGSLGRSCGAPVRRVPRPRRAAPAARDPRRRAAVLGELVDQARRGGVTSAGPRSTSRPPGVGDEFGGPRTGER